MQNFILAQRLLWFACPDLSFGHATKGSLTLGSRIRMFEPGVVYNSVSRTVDRTPFFSPFFSPLFLPFFSL